MVKPTRSLIAMMLFVHNDLPCMSANSLTRNCARIFTKKDPNWDEDMLKYLEQCKQFEQDEKAFNEFVFKKTFNLFGGYGQSHNVAVKVGKLVTNLKHNQDMSEHEYSSSDEEY